MQKWLVLTSVILTLCAGSALAATIEPQLAATLASADANQKFPVEFFMKAQANALDLDASLENLPKPQRRARVREVLEEFAAGTQRDLLDFLHAQDVSRVDDVRPLWLVNMVSCWATKDVILAVASRPDVAVVFYAKVPVKLVKPDLEVPPAPRDGVEPNLLTTQARGAWKQGYSGQGVVIGVVDTGVWYTHYDLRDHLWTSTEYPNCGFNFASSQYSSGHPGPSTYDTLTPLDFYGHGTHCAGITSADGAYGNGTRDTMGVAPSALIMSCPVDVYLHTPYPDTSMENNMVAGFQFCVSPTRDPTNGADVITTSLGLVSSWLPRRAMFRVVEENIEAAGLVHCIAAGNEGPTARTIRSAGDCPPPWPNPANHPTDRGHSAVITVGATDNSDNAASFTSIGPSDWGSIAPYNDYAYPPGLIDPDICAPGVNILSTYNSGNQSYTQMSGTSMATPGAAGCVALMFSKNPNLSPRQVDSILEMHAVRDLGPSGKDNTYGAGRINCSLAVAFTPMPSGVRLLKRAFDDAAGGNGDGIVNPGETVIIPTWVINIDDINRTGVTGTVLKSVPDPMFTILDSFKTFGAINAHDSAYTGPSGYRMSVSSSATNGQLLDMNLVCEDATDSTWLSGFGVAVGTPVLNYAGIVVYDSSGNSNGIIDPGEAVTMVARVTNAGGGHGYNVQGTLVCSDPRLNVTDPNGVYGSILRDSTKGNFADRYSLTADGGIPSGTPISCTLRLTADVGYSFARPFIIRVGMPATPGAVLADHDTGNCVLSVSCIGSIGFDTPNTPQEGSGFIYPKTGVTSLYYGGMMAGTDENYVVDRHYGVPATDINMDWAIVESVRFYPPNMGDQMIVGAYDDAGHGNPQGLKTTQTSYSMAAPGYDDFVIMIFDYENTGGAPINGFYSGMIGDFDIGTSTENIVLNDAARRAEYMQEDGVPNPTVGYKLLDPTTASNLSAIDHDRYVYPETAMSEGCKFAFMSGERSEPTSNRTYDWSVLVSAGPFDLPPGGRQRVAYAVVGGSDEVTFQEHADSAQSWYDRHFPPQGIQEKPLYLRPLNLAVTPNPFSRSTRITYALPRDGKLSIRIFDAAGREQAVLVNGPMKAGAGSVTWTPTDIARGVYFIRADLDETSIVRKVMIVH